MPLCWYDASFRALATYRHMIRAGVFAYPLTIKKSSYTDFLCLAWTPLVCHARDALSHKVVAALQYILNRAYASPCVVESDAASRSLFYLPFSGSICRAGNTILLWPGHETGYAAFMREPFWKLPCKKAFCVPANSAKPLGLRFVPDKAVKAFWQFALRLAICLPSLFSVALALFLLLREDFS